MMARQILVLGRLVGLVGALSAIALYAVFVYLNLYLFSLDQAGLWPLWYAIVGLMVAWAPGLRDEMRGPSTLRASRLDVRLAPAGVLPEVLRFGELLAPGELDPDRG